MDRGAGADDPVDVFLGIGSNLGDRLHHLAEGLRRLRNALEVTAVSPVVESPAQGTTGGEARHPDYLNAVVRARTTLTPQALLALCEKIETQGGRTRPYPNAPRTLDVDILFYGPRVIRESNLTVPHPRWRERGFVLQPLRALASGWTDPVTGQTVEHVCREHPEAIARVRTVASAEDLDRS